jgi:peptidoglycan/LPS O-acetylase OafA/YrhL
VSGRDIKFTYFFYVSLAATSNLLKSFSIYRNGDRLVSCQQSTSLDFIHCLNGIRAVSVVCIVWGHTYFISMEQPSINGVVFQEKWTESMFAMVRQNMNIVVDTFFVMGGLLVAKQFFKAREEK